MTTIKLNYEEVTKKLNDIKKALDSLILEQPPGDLLKSNSLEFTKTWLEREKNLNSLFIQYASIVQKNVEDTYANINLLKEQDEAIVRK
ncbi:YwqI/YxiC family protein [Metabacillus fastidiosus]|uniref:YwqI/YxiC family protein n=1 Tax=Metabacillus fastidiosus TaxID=1458 RepID=UPI002DB7C45A|nr:YwqI/YxiC family protein [Metabacillus fastidiosus]MEC2077225.1 YwqI/YxiC family protein [Metabacillus fastidiosus]